MAWVKIPKENHALFYARIPKDRRIQTLQMFGSAAAKVNGHLFGALFARSFMVKLSDADHAEALALDGAEPFDPMGTGRVMSSSVLMPESLMDEPEEMSAWLRRAFAYTVTLPPKQSPARSRATKVKAAKATPTNSAAKASPTNSVARTTRAKRVSKATPAKSAAKPSPASSGAKATRTKSAAKPSPANSGAKPTRAKRASKAAKRSKDMPARSASKATLQRA